MSKFQKTIKKKISFEGIGLHSGKKNKITLVPEKTNVGIYFYIDKQKIKANWKNAFITQLCTRLDSKKKNISTIEHLMSALCAHSITNLKIISETNEIPILDGSSKDFFEKLNEAGFEEQDKKIKTINIKKKVFYSQGNKYISIEPSINNYLEIDYTIDYFDEFIKKQQMIYVHNLDNYKKIYQARTFCLHKDLEKIFAMGLAKGGSLDNAIVVSGNKILNQGGLRYPNEFVKHKILDCIGDLYLSEFMISGKVKTYQGGHELNVMLLKEIFKNKKNYEITI